MLQQRGDLDNVGVMSDTFTIDTHLFVELGELLVGRDSTALAELVKNAYDADATEVTITAENIASGKGIITVADNGIGMTHDQFRKGFLTVAGRMKRIGDKRSVRFRRRFTGEKGVGRLAAQKLAHELHLESISLSGAIPERVVAHIDWDRIDSLTTLEEVAPSGAIEVAWSEPAKGETAGSKIELRGLRHPWTADDKSVFLAEVQAIEPPAILREPLKKSVVPSQLLFGSATIREAADADPGLSLTFGGEFAEAEDYWQLLADSATWVLEIEAKAGAETVAIAVSPTVLGRERYPSAKLVRYAVPHPNPGAGPFFQGRILCREGQWPRPLKSVDALRQAVGVRVFLEGFRIPPYGESGNDWLRLDADYTARGRSLPNLSLFESLPEAPDDEGLNTLPNTSYYGAIFLTAKGAPQLRTLVNREGFVPDESLADLGRLVRAGVDVLTRTRARNTIIERHQRRRSRIAPRNVGLGSALGATLARATELARDARAHIGDGDSRAASTAVEAAVAEIEAVGRLSRELISQASIVRVLASVGTQMAAFIHETNGLLHAASLVEGTLSKLATREDLDLRTRRDVRAAAQSMLELRDRLEREAAYLVDVVGADARRRRMRMSLSNRFDAAARLFEGYAADHRIEIRNEIPNELASPLMFPAELTTVFSNLLSNAIKAAGDGGRILAVGKGGADGSVSVTIANSGAAVDLASSEEWFEPYASSAPSLDFALGRGMGLGLTITRAMLAEYGATVRFVRPQRSFSTAVAVDFSAA